MDGWLKCSLLYLMVHIVVYDADLAKYFALNRIFGKPTRWKPKLIHTRSKLVMKHKMISFSNTCISFSMWIRAVVWKESCVWVLTSSLFSLVWHFSNLYLTSFQCNFYSALQDVRCNATVTKQIGPNSVFDQNVSWLIFAALKYPPPPNLPQTVHVHTSIFMDISMHYTCTWTNRSIYL